MQQRKRENLEKTFALTDFDAFSLFTAFDVGKPLLFGIRPL